MKVKPIPDFQHFLEYFPQVEPPLTLTSDLHHVFSQSNRPLSEPHIRQYLHQSDDQPDPYTEYVPCFLLPATENYQPLVFWKASLMTYEYILATYDSTGKLISSKVIAGTKSNGHMLLKRIATIDYECSILVAEGEGPLDERYYNANHSLTFQVDIDPKGIIHQITRDN